MGLVGVIRKEWNRPYMTDSHWDAMISGKRPAPPSDDELMQNTRQLPQDVGAWAAGAPSSITEEEMPVNDPRGDFLTAEGDPMTGGQDADYDPTDLSLYMDEHDAASADEGDWLSTASDADVMGELPGESREETKFENTAVALSKKAREAWDSYHKLKDSMETKMAQQKKSQPNRFKDKGFVHTKDGPKKLDPKTGLTTGMVGYLNHMHQKAEKAERKYSNHKRSGKDLEEYRGTGLVDPDLQGPSADAERGPQVGVKEPPALGAQRIPGSPDPTPPGRVRVTGSKKGRGRTLVTTRGPPRKGKLARRRAGPEED